MTVQASDRLAGEAEFQDTFKNVWANNADTLSLQYSGTEALKNDFTRTGKRSLIGLLNDGYNSVQRIYKSHFKDEERQDAIDMVQGHFVLDPMACERLMEEEVVEEASRTGKGRVFFAAVKLEHSGSEREVVFAVDPNPNPNPNPDPNPNPNPNPNWRSSLRSTTTSKPSHTSSARG